MTVRVLAPLLTLTLLAAPFAAGAQPVGKKVATIGFLSIGSPPSPTTPLHPTLASRRAGR